MGFCSLKTQKNQTVKYRFRPSERLYTKAQVTVPFSLPVLIEFSRFSTPFGCGKF